MYSALTYNAIVYEGFLPSSEFVTGGDTPIPRSNVRDLDDSIKRLGCGEPTFFLTSRCSSSGALCVLDGNVVSAKWDRRLDDVSEAELVMKFGGDATYTCCECLAEAEPWCHELHIWRDGEEVWVGPVQEIEYQRDQVTIKAKDSLAWLSVRVPPVDINTIGLTTDLTDVAVDLLEIAFAEDSPDYTCELDNLYTVPSGYSFDVFFPAFDQTALETLRDLSDAGLDFTTLGRTIVLFGDPSALIPLIILNDAHIMGDILVRKDGALQGNRFYVHFEGDGGIPASGEAVDKFCYGPIERMRDGDGLVSGVDAAATADIYVEASAIAPRTIELTPGSRLSPETPWVINEMVPGARVDVAVTRLCLNLTQSFRLTNVTVEYDPDEGESVGITVVPINSVTVE